jgi:hypothetical protein
MIKADANKIMISGELSTLLTEITFILNRLYFEMKNSIGEDQANEYLVDVGRFAVMPDDEFDAEKCEKSFS